MADHRNTEGYADITAYKAMKAVDGAETKAYYVFKTMVSVAKIGGFVLNGDIVITDGTGTKHSYKELKRRREGQNVEGLFTMRQDS